MKAGETFLCVRCVMTPPTTTIDDRNAPSYDRTATLGRIAQKLSLWRGSAALKPQLAKGTKSPQARYRPQPTKGANPCGLPFGPLLLRWPSVSL